MPEFKEGDLVVCIVNYEEYFQFDKNTHKDMPEFQKIYRLVEVFTTPSEPNSEYGKFKDMDAGPFDGYVLIQDGEYHFRKLESSDEEFKLLMSEIVKKQELLPV